jgi:hypothetical protein
VFLRGSPFLALSRFGVTTTTETDEEEVDNSAVATGVFLRGTLREYVGGRTFLLAASDGNIRYERDRTENEGEEETLTNFDVRADLRLGIGVGRVRVVTPVIRALRVRERLRTVAPGTSVSDGQVQAAARQLARRPGYQAVYDRPDKYFWRDFFDQVNLAERSAFETFYVADVLREPVGLRREGAEFVAGPFGTYDRVLRREERDGQLIDRTSFEAGTVGGFARGRWYRNVTLRHQLGVDAEATYRHFVDSQGPLDHELGLDAEGQWLWVLADRLRLDTRLRANVRFQSDPRGGETFRPSQLYLLSSDLVLFIENSLSLSVGANAQYRYDATSSSGFQISEFDTGLQFRINYVMSRALR